MIQISAHTRILVAVEPVDFRCGIDALAALCRQRLEADPLWRTLFVFLATAKGSAMRKSIAYDSRKGFWLCHKRLSSGRFRFWPSAAGAPGCTLEATELQVLLMGGDPAAIRVAPAWRPLKLAA